MEDILTFIAGVVLGGLLSWLITHSYYVRAGRDQKSELERLAGKLKPRNTLKDFEALLESSAWSEHYINDQETWIAEQDNTFQIVRGDRLGEFGERWTKVFPDQNGSSYPVFLKIQGIVVYQLQFVSLDGGRIFVPMPEIRPVGNSTVEYFWHLGSLEIKVARIIGNYYIHKTLEGVAKVTRVALVE